MTATGPLLQDAIRKCQFHSSCVEKDQINDVFIATLGLSKAWLIKLQSEDYAANEEDSCELNTHLLHKLWRPALFMNEISLYPYLFKFYSLGKVFFLPYLTIVLLACRPCLVAPLYWIVDCMAVCASLTLCACS